MSWEPILGSTAVRQGLTVGGAVTYIHSEVSLEDTSEYFRTCSVPSLAGLLKLNPSTDIAHTSTLICACLTHHHNHIHALKWATQPPQTPKQEKHTSKLIFAGSSVSLCKQLHKYRLGPASLQWCKHRGKRCIALFSHPHLTHEIWENKDQNSLPHYDCLISNISPHSCSAAFLKINWESKETIRLRSFRHSRRKPVLVEGIREKLKGKFFNTSCLPSQIFIKGIDASV